ncbi:hypothetical protein GALMADRAFT_751982 [Galerina marginata CBS 339.88]|uniref:Uncharacterized protein n=1 Tax=Galerina marginata (strain CBS 339.88) TaxID=685588 RepID=A0A067SXY2_GALM3|nr:hypothetical protein GALMADRAFT_751982 [Galerina marginata CBS 339.88]
MPVPGQKTSRKANNTLGPGWHSKADKQNSPLDYHDGFDGWRDCVDYLCDAFKIPDLTSRRGLKKIHANFDDIYARLDDLYQSNQDIKVRAAIVAIFSKLCLDSILRTKLFEKVILDKIIPFLSLEETRHLAFRALSVMTHHSGEEVKVEIARYANKLAEITRGLPGDERLGSLCAATLCHTVSAVLIGLPCSSNMRIYMSLDFDNIFECLLETAKRARFYAPGVIYHIVTLLSVSAGILPAFPKATTLVTGFLAAGMRSKNWSYRCACLKALIDISGFGAKEDMAIPEQPHYITSVQKEMPEHLQIICINYEPKECENQVILTCQMECVEAMLDYPKNLDLYLLGKKLVRLILITEFPFPQNATFFGEEFSASTLAVYNNKPPFVQWMDGLPLCAKALREHGTEEDGDSANVLDVKYLIDSERLTDAIDLAKRCLRHNSGSKFTAYFYYTLTLLSDDLQTLGPVKKGLKCKELPPFIKHHLLQRAVQCACRQGLRVWRNNLEEGVALLSCAFEDAKIFIAEAPPDSRHMRNVTCWCVLLTILFKTEIDSDLKELEEMLYRLDIADDFSAYIGHVRSKSLLRLAQQGLVKHYRLGVAEFERSFAESEKDNSDPAIQLPSRKNQKDVTAWLEEMQREDGTKEPVINCGSSSSKDGQNLDHERVVMYCCSWCGNPSAAVRKCSKCSKTKYYLTRSLESSKLNDP